MTSDRDGTPLRRRASRNVYLNRRSVEEEIGRFEVRFDTGSTIILCKTTVHRQYQSNAETAIGMRCSRCSMLSGFAWSDYVARLLCEHFCGTWSPRPLRLLGGTSSTRT